MKSLEQTERNKSMHVRTRADYSRAHDRARDGKAALTNVNKSIASTQIVSIGPFGTPNAHFHTSK